MFNFVEVAIGENESLQSISLKYRVPVFELKRLNNIITNDQIYQRNSIKIPLLITLDHENHKYTGNNDTNSSSNHKTMIEADDVLTHVDTQLLQSKSLFSTTRSYQNNYAFSTRLTTKRNSTDSSNLYLVLICAISILCLLPVFYFMFLKVEKGKLLTDS
ncbi:hypothetical protein GJ496_004558 [Pomphorhynchus laevis]|nr:hypothetical protein GJ496_004558 [Pomphorhynchus laevis]